jgi:hypothetical protein
VRALRSSSGTSRRSSNSSTGHICIARHACAGSNKTVPLQPCCGSRLQRCPLCMMAVVALCTQQQRQHACKQLVGCRAVCYMPHAALPAAACQMGTSLLRNK